MGIARKWVFPIIRIVVFIAIAGALVKIAFFADPTPEPDAASPTGQIVEPQVAVALGTIRNDVTLKGTVEADDAVAVKATLSGVVREVFVSVGQHVDPGTEILTLRAEVANPDGTSYVDYETVVAPTGGILSSFAALKGETFSVGDDLGTVAPPSFNVTGSIDPAQQYRLLNQPTEAQVTITGGPAPFTCTGLAITSPIAGASGEEATSTSAPTVRCAVPAEVTVFVGLTAELVLGGGIAENVLVVPITAVEGASQAGSVHFVLPDGSIEPRPVSLGINDGVNVQIVDGVMEGDMILEFIPGAPSATDGLAPGECMIDKSGVEVCK